MSRKRMLEALTILLALAAPAVEGAPRWEIRADGGGWQLLRDGQPFHIKGAVAPNRFDVLAACGGNAVRVNASRKALDAAQAAGLAVMANLPVRGERNQLDWDNAGHVAKQKEKVLAVVRELKDHPALMFWSAGNELDHIPGNIRPEVVIPPGSYAGGLEKRAEPIPGLVREPAAAATGFTAPRAPGAYRLFVAATDGHGHIAYGNLPFRVDDDGGERLPITPENARAVHDAIGLVLTNHPFAGPETKP